MRVDDATAIRPRGLDR